VSVFSYFISILRRQKSHISDSRAGGNEIMSEKSLKDAIDEGEVKMIERKCPKCGMALISDNDTIWCSNNLCRYEEFL
jgi:uncharacterized Zn finger protein (UPF0148 family)